VAAVAARGQRDLQAVVAARPRLFPPGAFDPALLGLIALANATSAPWLDAVALRAANRAALWAFAVDRLVDVVATTRAEVDSLTRRCRAVAAGAPAAGDDAAAALLADLRDGLAAGPSYAVLAPTWRREAGRMLAAMAREWRWVRAGTRPSVAEYLANADNLGLSFVYASHLVATLSPSAAGRRSALLATARAAQRAVRVVNDLATEERDRATGDLNLLRLGVSRPRAAALLDTLVAECRTRCAGLRDELPQPVDFLERQVEFNLGFHPRADYWPGG
jgi:hypothetical protein